MQSSFYTHKTNTVHTILDFNIINWGPQIIIPHLAQTLFGWFVHLAQFLTHITHVLFNLWLHVRLFVRDGLFALGRCDRFVFRALRVPRRVRFVCAFSRRARRYFLRILRRCWQFHVRLQHLIILAHFLLFNVAVQLVVFARRRLTLKS